MKYTYAYKTSDGTRHEDSIESESRDAAFATLRKRGIRPIKVVAADGSKANGEIRGVRKRVVAALVLLAAVGVGVASFHSGTRTGAREASLPENASPRHQIYGDPAIMVGFERGDLAEILPRVGDQLLAVFAEPGRLLCAKNVNPRLFTARQLAPFVEYAAKDLAPETDLKILSDEPREIRELKQIVNGMRQELRDYLANGNGTPVSYWRRLVQRTTEEMQIFERTRRELETVTDQTIWEQRNAALRRIGLRTIPTPADAE